MSVLKEALRFYKQRRQEEKDKEKLINAKMNFNLLEQLVQRVNDNPSLKIVVNMVDGTSLTLETYNKKANTVYGQIDGVEYIR